MNECEQTHPLLRGYLDDSLSARDRRMVARHLNLCASARKELDRLRSGPIKSPATPANPPSEPWDLRILRWMFKTNKPAQSKPSEVRVKKSKPVKAEAPPTAPASRRKSPMRPLIGILLFFGALVLLTHFVQNIGDNSIINGAKRWLSKKGFHVAPSLDMVLDLSDMAHWGGNAAPVAIPYHELITDPDRFNIYWMILEPGIPQPNVDFSKHALAVVFMGAKTTSGYNVRFKVMKNFTDKTVLEYDEITPAPGEASAIWTRPWVIQMVPKPTQEPVVIQKIQ
jgi:hypothetical protein